MKKVLKFVELDYLVMADEKKTSSVDVLGRIVMSTRTKTEKLLNFLIAISVKHGEVRGELEQKLQGVLKELIDMVDNKEISSKQAKDVFYEALDNRKDPKAIVEEGGMKQNSDDGEIRKIIIEILDNNLDNVNKYKSGRTNVLDFFVGQVMKQTRGQANPELTRSILTEELSNR